MIDNADRIYEHPTDGRYVFGWPDDPHGFAEDDPASTMLVHVARGHGALTTMRRCQFDGNRPPRFRWPDGVTYDVAYAPINVGECAICHGVVPNRLHTQRCDNGHGRPRS